MRMLPDATAPVIDATLARLDALDVHCRYVAGDPDGGGWYRLDRTLADDDLLDAWFAGVLVDHAGGHRDVAGSYLASWLAGTIAETAVAALITEGRAWPIAPSTLAIHRHDEGWFDGIAVRGARLRVLPTDRDAGAAGVEVVASPERLRAVLAEELTGVTTTIFTAVRRRAPFGLRGMWGNLVDGITAGALWRAHQAGIDQAVARTEALALVAALVHRAGRTIPTPRFERVDWSGGVALVPVKTTCCLYYKTFDGTPDRRGEGYCTSCPLRDGESRRALWSTWLDSEAR
jgi:hypothetical protein